MKIEGNPLNTQEKEEKEEEEKEEKVVVFSRENRGGSAQHATHATPTRSSHGPMRALYKPSPVSTLSTAAQ